MKTNRNKLSAAAVLAGLMIGLGTPVVVQAKEDMDQKRQWSSQDQDRRSARDHTGVMPATSLLKDQTASEYTGAEVISSSGEKLGTLNDFVIDTGSGRVVYGLVGTGGFLGVGERLRAVPMGALSQQGGEDRQFVIDIDKARWESAPRIRNEEIANLGRDNRGNEIFSHYGQNWDDSARGDQRRQLRDRQQQTAQGSLILASDLDGKNVRSSDREVGDIEDVVVDVHTQQASVLLDPNDNFTGTNDKFVLPFNRLTLDPTDEDRITTTLSRSDFERTAFYGDRDRDRFDSSKVYTWSGGRSDEARPGQDQRYTDQRSADERHADQRNQRNYTDQRMRGQGDRDEARYSDHNQAPQTRNTDRYTADSRYGRGVRDQRVGDSSVELQNRSSDPDRNWTPAGDTRTRQQGTTVDAIRGALQNDASLRGAGRQVSVMEQDGRIVLRGVVPSEQIKSQIERAAEQAAANREIENRLTVREDL